MLGWNEVHYEPSHVPLCEERENVENATIAAEMGSVPCVLKMESITLSPHLLLVKVIRSKILVDEVPSVYSAGKEFL